MVEDSENSVEKNITAIRLDNFVKTEVPSTTGDDEKLKQIKRYFFKRFNQVNDGLQEHLIIIINQKPNKTVQQYYPILLIKSSWLKKI